MKNNMTIIIAAVLVVVAIVVFLVLSGKKAPTTAATAGLQITDVVMGTGTEAVAGDTVTVNYVGSFPNGQVFDASANHGADGFSFVLGAGEVIKGWDEGVLGMKVGGERKLVVPPDLGYGATGTLGGPIPPNATLDFTITLLKVQKPQ